MQNSLSHRQSILFIAVFSIAIYANTLQNGFLYDDVYTVVNNRFIKSLDNLPQLLTKDYFLLSSETTYRPLVTLTYFLDYAVYGLNPWGFHLTNILLHVTNGVLLYTFLASLLKDAGFRSQKLEVAAEVSSKSLIISVLFVSHPVLAEAINAVSFREDLLVFFFYISTLILYVRLRSTSGQCSKSSLAIYFISCITYSFALLSKEMAVTLPLIVCCYEWIFGDKKKRASSFLYNYYLLGYIAVTISYVYIRFFYFFTLEEEIGLSWSLIERVSSLSWLILNHIKLTIFPVSLSAEYIINPAKSIFSPFVIASSIGLICLLALALKMKKHERIIAFGILFFIIALIPVYNIIPISNPLADRYLYLPSIGFAVVLGTCIFKGIFQSSKHLTQNPHFLALSFIIAIYSLLSGQRNLKWQDEYSLWFDAVKKMPNSSRAHNGLGLSYARHDMFDEAANEYLAALKLNPNNTNVYVNLGVVYTIQGKLDNAILQYQTALKLNPKKSDIHNNLGYIYRRQGQIEDSIRSYETALRWNPDDIKARYNLGLIYVSMGFLKKARAELETALKIVPEFLPARQALESLANSSLQSKLHLHPSPP